jgi:hypothetical protein
VKGSTLKVNIEAKYTFLVDATNLTRSQSNLIASIGVANFRAELVRRFEFGSEIKI